MTARVLFIINKPLWAAIWRRELGGMVEFVSVVSIREAENECTDSLPFNAIVVDVRALVDLKTAGVFAKRLKEVFRFAGPILATSSNKDEHRQLVEAGYRFGCHRAELPATLRGVLPPPDPQTQGDEA